MNPERKNREVALGPRALAICCDATAHDAAVRNEELRVENASLKRIHDQLNELVVYSKSDQAANIDLTAFDSQDKTHFIYKMDNTPTIPQGCFDTHFRLAGVPICPEALGMTNRDGETIVQYAFFGDFSQARILIEGVIEKQNRSSGDSTTLEEALSDLTRFWYRMGMNVHVPVEGPGDMSVFDGVTFRFETIRIAKHFLRPMLPFRNRFSPPSATHTDSQLRMADEDQQGRILQTFAQVLPNHEGIVKAVEDYKALMAENTNLKLIRDIFQTVNIGIQGDKPLLRFKLEDGTKSRMRLPRRFDDDNLPAGWRLEPKPGEEEAAVFMSSVESIQVTFADLPMAAGTCWDTRVFLMAEGRGFALKLLGGIFNAELFFLFHEDIHVNSLQLPMPLGPRAFALDLRRQEYANYPARLVYFQIELASIQDRLELLGIDADATDVSLSESNSLNPQQEFTPVVTTW